jgi:hypothetical protein
VVVVLRNERTKTHTLTKFQLYAATHGISVARVARAGGGGGGTAARARA